MKTPTKLDRYYYFTHFMDEETEYKEDTKFGQEHTANKRSCLNPLSWSPFPVTRSKFLPNRVVNHTE